MMLGSGSTKELRSTKELKVQNKEVLKRIYEFSRERFDPLDDASVIDILRRRFNILLPQRRSLDDQLSSVASDHEVIELLKAYRNVKASAKPRLV